MKVKLKSAKKLEQLLQQDPRLVWGMGMAVLMSRAGQIFEVDDIIEDEKIVGTPETTVYRLSGFYWVPRQLLDINYELNKKLEMLNEI